jgi:hypothetical protein
VLININDDASNAKMKGSRMIRTPRMIEELCASGRRDRQEMGGGMPKWFAAGRPDNNGNCVMEECCWRRFGNLVAFSTSWTSAI